MSFVSDYLNHHNERESPGSFWRWSAYTAISAVLRNNVYIQQGDSKLYANIYVVEYAESAARKAAPVEFCEELVNSIKNTKVISGRASIQAILEELSHGETDRKTGNIIKGGAATFFARELEAGLVADAASLSILTDIYDYKYNFGSLLKSGRFNVEGLVFSMYGASNEALLKTVYNTRAIGGGLLRRTFIIVPNEFRPSNSLLRVKPNPVGVSNLTNKLRIISNLSGIMEWKEDAIDEYDAWYIPFRESYRQRGDRVGIAGGMGTSIKKIAIILAANDNSMSICKCHVEGAIEDCLGILPNYNQLVMSSGTSTASDVGAIFLQELIKAPNNMMTKRAMLQRNWGVFECSVQLLDQVVITFETSGFIQVAIDRSETTFILTEKAKDIMGGK